MPLVSRTFDQLISFTRTSAATYVNSAGNIVTTPASKNLLTFTEEFDNAAWSKSNTTVTENSVAAPDGLMTADTFTASAGAAAHNIHQSAGGSGAAITMSIYAKAGTTSFIQLYHGAASNTFANFNLAAGVVGTVGAASTASITSVGDGWYRCTMTCTPGTASANRVAMISSATSAYNESWTAAGTETVHLWGAQLEVGSTATSYVRNFGGLFPPRFDYDPVTLQPRGLLIEEQRTNLLLRSEEFDNAAWTTQRSTVTANATTSPDGTVDADRLVDTTDSGTHRVFSSTGKASSAIEYTGSVYFKADTLGFATLRLAGPGETNFTSVGINLSTGELSSLSTTGFTNASASVANAGNGWWRLMLTGTSDAASSITMMIGVATTLTASSSYVGDGTSGIFLWGAQLEAGPFATSYIPTVASQVTRTADQASIVAPNFAPWYNQSEGTFVVEADTTVAVSTNVYKSMTVSDGTAANYMATFQYSTNWGSVGVVGSVTQFDRQPSGSYTSGVPAKVAMAYKANDFAVSVGGSAPLTDNAGAVPAASQMNIGNRLGSGHLNGHIRRISYYPSRLSNAQLQALSS